MGQFPSFVGEGRQIRDSSPIEEDADDSETNEDGEPSPRRVSDRRGPKQMRSSGCSRGRAESRGAGRQSNPRLEDSCRSSVSAPKSIGWGPRVKQVSRHALQSGQFTVFVVPIPSVRRTSCPILRSLGLLSTQFIACVLACWRVYILLAYYFPLVIIVLFRY